MVFKCRFYKRHLRYIGVP